MQSRFSTCHWIRQTTLLGALVLAMTTAANAQLLDTQARRLSFQAHLTDNQGQPLPGPTVDLAFMIYTTLENPIEGPIVMNDVPIVNGTVDVMIPVGSASFDGLGRKLGVSVDGGAELSPKLELGAVPYAMRVNRVESIELADNIDLGSAAANGSLRLLTTAGQTGVSLDAPAGLVRAQQIFQIYDFLNSTTAGNFGRQSGGGVLQTFDELGSTTTRLGSATSVGGFMEFYRGTGGTSVFIDGDDGTGAGLVDVRNAAQISLIKLNGSNGQVQTFGTDGDERVSLGGTTSGSLSLRDNSAVPAITAELEATTTSGGQLSLFSSGGVNGVFLDGNNGDGGAYLALYDGGALRVGIDANNGAGGGVLMNLRNSLGNVTLALDADSSDDSVLSLNDSTGTASIRLNSDSVASAGEIAMYAVDGSTKTVQIIAAETTTTGAQIALRNAAGVATIVLDAEFGSEGGRITTSVLEITGGSDLSEQFDITAATTIEPGMVVSIDPAKEGNLVLSDKAYDRTVAGIVSGAGGVRTGFVMGQKGTLAAGKHPVALTGRVYCWCDAADGSISPGDLLTTSSVAGHAMKVTDNGKATGAILGKAMSSLESGRGLVLVLVSLQ